MRPEFVRPIVFAGLFTLLCACASTPDDQAPAGTSVGGTHAAMSNKGLANLNLAHNYMAAGQLDYAIDRANRALRTDPQSPDVQIVLGLISEELDDGARAGQYYATAVKYAPEAGHVLNVRAVWLCRTGDTAGADALFARAIKDPFYKNKQQAFFNAGKCSLQAGRLDQAEQYLRQGVEVAPEDPRLLAELAEVKCRQGDYMAARAFYQRREALGEPTAELLSLAARIEQGAGDTAAADRYRRQLNEQFPNYTPPATEGSRQP
jgi:type IV pilus assembly protein PilF